jgi:hypothetical protein
MRSAARKDSRATGHADACEGAGGAGTDVEREVGDEEGDGEADAVQSPRRPSPPKSSTSGFSTSSAAARSMLDEPIATRSLRTAERAARVGGAASWVTTPDADEAVTGSKRRGEETEPEAPRLTPSKNAARAAHAEEGPAGAVEGPGCAGSVGEGGDGRESALGDDDGEDETR